ncbi:MAG: hypothetical protein ACOCRK_00780 [bacterium]
MAKVNDHAYDSETNKQLNTHRASGMLANDLAENHGHALATTSTNIEVFANGQKIGFVQSLTPSEQRQIAKVQELGTEGVVQSVPYNTQGGQLAITRLAVYNSNLYNAVGATRSAQYTPVGEFTAGTAVTSDSRQSGATSTYANPFKTLKDQRVPLEFKVKTKMPNTEAHYYIETYIDCWLSSYTKTIAANQITISEQATVQYSDVYADYA